MIHYQEKSSGFTLVELLIASGLGVVIIFGAITILSSTRQNTDYQQALSFLQENGRIAENLLARSVRMAGFCSRPDNFVGCLRQYSPPNIAIAGAEGGADRPDEVTLRFESDAAGLDRDCAGELVANGAIITNVFSVQALDSDGNTVPYATQPDLQYALFCSGRSGDSGVRVVDGIENMQIVYGEDVNSDQTPDRRVTADQVVDWDNVITLSLSFLVNSVESISTTEQRTFNLLGVQLNTNDARLRYQYDLIIQLRNRVE